jgi:hypothetical protein
MGHFFYFAVSIVIPLVMLNLLIAVISETFNKVMSTQEISDRSQQNEVILELETFYALWTNYKGIEEHAQEHLIFAEYNSDY